MASIVTPVKFKWGKWVEHEELSSDLEKMNFEVAYHAAVFFYTLFNVSMQVIQPYLINEMKSKGIAEEQAKEMLTTSQSILDGFIMPKWSQTSKEYLLNRFGV
jgi:hypothetical protein